MRHTYATMSLAAGVSLFSLSRRMGTSLDMIDRTSGIWRRMPRPSNSPSSTPTT